MSLLKRFAFFQKEQLTDDGSDAPHSGIQALDITCVTTGRGRMVIGDAGGSLTFIDRSVTLRTFAAHDIRVTHAHLLKQRDLLLTVGDGADIRPEEQQRRSKEVSRQARAAGAGPAAAVAQDDAADAIDAAASDAVLKVWKLDRLDQSGGLPQCVRTIKLSATLSNKERPPWPADQWPAVTCMDALEDLTQVALGLSNGFTLLIRGDILRDRGQRYTTLPPPSFKPRPGAEPGVGGAGGSTMGTVSVASTSSTAHAAFSAGSSDGGKTQMYPPVSGVGFCERHEHTATRSGAVSVQRAVWLWVVAGPGHGGGVRAFNTETAARSGFLRTAERYGEIVAGPLLDNEGCGAHCSCVVHETRRSSQMPSAPQSISTAEGTASTGRGGLVPYFVVGKSDRINYFTTEDPGACYAVQGAKEYLHWFGNYLLIVSNANSRVQGRTARGSGINGSVMEPPRRDEVKLFDFKNKFIAMSFTLRSEVDGHVVSVVSEWGVIFVITSMHRVFQLTEKDTQTKLSDLFKRNLYPTAISLAHSSQCDYGMVMEIFRMYGDHLYAKGNFDDAITQYVRTIGHVEPSYVIRRFLDAQRIQNLTVYLEALHSQGKPSGEHTTLLLNCYTKQKQEEKLKDFVRNDAVEIDVEAAITVLRSAGYFPEALFLARKNAQHEWFLRMQLEDVDGFGVALNYISKLRFLEAEQYMKDYGKVLMTALPAETTALLQELCSSEIWPGEGGQREHSGTVVGPGDDLYGADGTEEQGEYGTRSMSSNAEDFIHIFVDHPKELREFLANIVASEGDDEDAASPLVWNTLLELTLSLEMPREGTKLTVEGGKAAGNDGSDVVNNKVVRDHDSAASDDELKARAEDAVMAVLGDPAARYDPNHALVLVQRHGFKQGQLYLYDKLRMYHMLVRHYMETGDNYAIISKCKVYGAHDPNLWVQVLMHFAQRDDNCERELRQVLHHIEKMQVLPPLLVVQVLARNPKMPLSIVRSFIVGQLEQLHSLIDDDRTWRSAPSATSLQRCVATYLSPTFHYPLASLSGREINQLQEDTARMRKEIHDLTSRPKIFKSTKCAYTGAPLELPTVHFLSGNSYNLSSLPGAGLKSGGGLSHDRLEDPKRASEQQSVFEIMAGLKRRNNQGVHEEFFNDLESSKNDGFETIADYFGKCLFSEDTPTPMRSASSDDLRE